MSEEKKEKRCKNIYGINLCVDDYVVVIPRTQSLASFEGKVVYLGAVALTILESDGDLVSIRYRDIRMLRVKYRKDKVPTESHPEETPP